MPNDNPKENYLATNPVARVTGVLKNYPGVLALDNVSFSIQPGEVRALLGKNGAGKSTLIRMLTGAEVPDVGEIFINSTELIGSSVSRTKAASSLGLRSVYQELSLVPDMDVSENMFMGQWPLNSGMIDIRRMHEAAKKVLNDLGFPIQTGSLVSSLSPAHQQLVEIARAMMGEPKIVILDEPTSSLANEEVELVFEAVRRISAKGIAVLYVSHRMKEVRTIASTATIMRDGRIIGTVKVAEASIEEIVKMMLGKTADDKLPIAKRKFDQKILEVSDIKQHPRLKGVSFSLSPGEVLGIAGLLGSGRTELLRIIAGIDQPDSGCIIFEGKSIDSLSFPRRINAGIAFTPENRKDDGIFPLLGVDENIVLCDWTQVSISGVLDKEKVNEKTSEIVSRMSIKTASNQMPVETLSGGNQQKIVIGRWIYAGSSVLLLDEPTRGIDVEAKVQIYNLVRTIAKEGKSVIFVSSEIEELPSVCDRVIVLREGRIDKEFIAPDIDAEALMSASIT